MWRPRPSKTALSCILRWKPAASPVQTLAQPLALLMLNVDASQRAADAAARSELESSLSAHLARINETLDPHEQLDCLVVTSQAWTVDNDLITPTFKVKRNKIEERFAADYDKWVRSRKKVIFA